MPPLDEELRLLTSMSPAQLRAEWRRVNRTTAEVMSPDLLRRGIAYRLQKKANGGLPGDITRRLERLARQLAKTGDLEIAKDISLKSGTRLMREWHGKVYQVTSPMTAIYSRIAATSR